MHYCIPVQRLLDVISFSRSLLYNLPHTWYFCFLGPGIKLAQEMLNFTVLPLSSNPLQPLLDVILFTRSLARTMGYKGQMGLYAYYVCVALLLRAASPPLASMAAQEAGLSGSLRAAHQRLVTHAEEVGQRDGVAECWVVAMSTGLDCTLP